MIPKYKIGDKVVLEDYEFMCKNRGVSVNNETFQRHYNYIKSKEPLEIFWVWKPGELKYGEEDYDINRRGKDTHVFYYNIHTPRSKMYLFEECELKPYIENIDDV